MKAINVLIADDHKLIRETLGYLLSSDSRFNVVALCGNSEQAVEITKALQPDIVLMDINITPISGFEATQKICLASPFSKVIGLSMHTHPEYAKKMLKSGASGYVTKNSPREEMINAILEVNSAKKYVCQEINNIIADNLLNGKNDEPDISSLTVRELQVVKFIQEGLSSSLIANEIHIGVRTVEAHRYNIMRKLKLRNAASLVNFVSMHSEFAGKC
jgi:DNA-binding NarL/FixJ family response regulator